MLTLPLAFPQVLPVPGTASPALFGHLLFVLGFVLRHHLLQEAASHPGPLRPQEAVMQWDPASAQSAGF